MSDTLERRQFLKLASLLTGGVAVLADVLPGFDASTRIYIAAPAGTPPAIVAQLGRALKAVLDAPDLAPQAAKQGFVPAWIAGNELVADLQRESAQWGKVVTEQKITAE